MSPSVSIVLPVWNGAADLRTTLPAIAAQEYDGEVEIIAIDSGSSDDSLKLLREVGARVWEIEQRDFGHGKTRNFGVRQSQNDIIVFLSQDACPVGTHWLGDLVAVLSDKSIGAAFARQLAQPGATPLEQFFHAEIYPAKSRRVNPKKRAPTPQEVFFSNVCSAARREVCLRFPFDESLIMSEDQIFARTLLQNGLALQYAANVEVVHSHSYSLGALFRRNFDSGYSLRGFNTESPSRSARRLARFWGSEARFLVKSRAWGTLAQMPLYETTRVAAFVLGGQGGRIPLGLRRKMSLHRAFWEDTD